MPEKAVVDQQSTNIDSILQEQRKFECPPEFARQAHMKSLEEYERLYKESIDDPDKFWSRIAGELHWFKKWDKVLEWNCPWAKWFVGGEINLSYNCLDRHVTTRRKNKAAIIWESEPGEVRTLTYQQLHREVQKFANVLKVAGREERRPRCHLHGHDARAAHRHAGLRPHRRPAHRSLRRILFQRPGRPHPRLASLCRHHAGRILPPRRRGETCSPPSKRR